MNRVRLEADVIEKWLATPPIVLCKRVYLPKPQLLVDFTCTGPACKVCPGQATTFHLWYVSMPLT